MDVLGCCKMYLDQPKLGCSGVFTTFNPKILSFPCFNHLPRPFLFQYMFMKPMRNYIPKYKLGHSKPMVRTPQTIYHQNTPKDTLKIPQKHFALDIQAQPKGRKEISREFVSKTTNSVSILQTSDTS